MTCRILIVGLMLLAVFLPLAASELVVFVLAAPVAVDGGEWIVRPGAQSVAFLAAASLRGPPSR